MPKLVSGTRFILDDTKLKFECTTVVLDKYHWMLYYLVTAMYPRFLITLNEDLENLPVTVRVGQVSRILFSNHFGMVLMGSTRPLTWLDKLESLARSPVSRRTKRRCAWVRQREQSWRRKSISHMHMFWRDSSSCERILGTKRKMQCNCNFGPRVLWNNMFTLNALCMLRILALELGYNTKCVVSRNKRTIDEPLRYRTKGHLVRDRIIYPPQRPNRPIESRRLDPSCKMEHRRRPVPHGYRQECKLGIRVSFLNDTHDHELSVLHCEPGFERLSACCTP